MPSVAFDQAVGYYDSTRGFAPGVADRIRDAIVTRTQAHLQTRFLELGVGTGRIAIPFIVARYDYTGVDISQPMMDQLTTKLAAFEPTQLHYQLKQADITNLPFEDNSFDVAIGVHVLHLVDGWQKALQEANRVLHKPGGYLIMAHDSQDQNLTDSPNRIVNQKWDSILQELGVSRAGLRSGVQNFEGTDRDTQIEDYLRELGGQPENLTLVEHETLPLSVRQMAQRHIDRMYSGDWHLSEDAHAQASQQLQNWLANDVADPDKPITITAQFKAIITRW